MLSWTGTGNHKFEVKLKEVIHQRWILNWFSFLVLKRAEMKIHGYNKGLWFPFLESLAVPGHCFRVADYQLWQKIGMKYNVKHPVPKVAFAAGMYHLYHSCLLVDAGIQRTCQFVLPNPEERNIFCLAGQSETAWLPYWILNVVAQHIWGLQYLWTWNRLQKDA